MEMLDFQHLDLIDVRTLLMMERHSSAPSALLLLHQQETETTVESPRVQEYPPRMARR